MCMRCQSLTDFDILKYRWCACEIIPHDIGYALIFVNNHDTGLVDGVCNRIIDKRIEICNSKRNDSVPYSYKYSID